MTKQILVGGVPIGGGAPVVIQSMLNTKTTCCSMSAYHRDGTNTKAF